MVAARAIDTAFHAHLVVVEGRGRREAARTPPSHPIRVGARRGYNRASALSASNRCRLRVSRPSVTVSSGSTFLFGCTRAVALAVLSEVVTGTKFMVGVPMKPATQRLAGWS